MAEAEVQTLINLELLDHTIDFLDTQIALKFRYQQLMQQVALHLQELLKRRQPIDMETAWKILIRYLNQAELHIIERLILFP